MSKKPDGTRKSKKTGEDKGKPAVCKVLEVKPRNPRPDFTPRVKKQEQEERNAAVNAEAMPEAKKALASGFCGLYFICGEFFRIWNKPIISKPGETSHVIEDENGNHIPFAWTMFPDYKWDAMELKGSPERVSAMKNIRTKILEYASAEIKEAKVAFAMKRRQEEDQKSFAAKVAEAHAAIISSASDDLALMFWRRQDGTFKFPDGVVMKVEDSKAEVLIGNNEFGISKCGKDSFFLHMSTLSTPTIHPNGKIKDEKTRAGLHAWQSKVHAYLVAAKAVTPQPATAKVEVVASDNLDDMFHKDVAGNYAVGGLVVKLEKNQKGDCYRVLVGNDQVSASEQNFLPTHLLDRTINPNWNIPNEEARMKINAWQVALQTVLKTAKAKLPPVAVEAKPEVAEVVTAEPLPQRTQAYQPKCLEIPSLKASKVLTVEMLKSMPTHTTGLFHVSGGKGRAYLYAEKGKLWLIQMSSTFPKDHVLARILEAHNSKNFEENELVDIGIHAIRQIQPLDEIKDVSEIKNARRAMQRFLRRMMVSASEMSSEEMATPVDANPRDTRFPPNTALAGLMAVLPKVSHEQPQHAHQ